MLGARDAGFQTDAVSDSVRHQEQVGRRPRVNNREGMVLEALGDLRKCLEFADEMGNVEYVDGADPHLEIGALYEISLEEPSPPVIVFRNIKGYPAGHRVV